MSASSDDLRRLQSRLTRVLVGVGVTAMTFTAANVTKFATEHGIDQRIAWTLDPMVGVALGAVLIADGVLAEHGVRPGGWATALRWFAGLATWLMNCWTSIWPDGTPMGVPHHVHPAGLLLHSVPPVLLIVLAEAITVYRRSILTRITELEETEPVTSGEVVDTTAAPEASTPVEPEPISAPAAPEPVASPLVICGGRAVYSLEIPPASTDGSEKDRLLADRALNVIRTCWVMGDTIAVAARKSTRSTSYVHKVYKRLAEQAEGDGGTSAEHVPGQLALTGGGAQ